MIDPKTIDEIKNQMDILEVVGDYVSLKKSGSSYKALSPFTAEKTPSFYVVPSKGIFKCFSSGKGGDAITFLMEVDGMSYLEAIKLLAQKYGIPVEEQQPSEETQAAQSRREGLYLIVQFAQDFYKGLLWHHDEGQRIGLEYLKERRISEEMIKKFDLGYSLDQWDHLLNEAKKKGYQEDRIEEAGLILKNENKTYDRFRGRVMFPIHNVSGKPIAFGGRMLGSDKKQPKYVNSPETDLYNKSRVLYGLYHGKKSIRQEENCFLVEGYTDVIALHQAGIENVVSSSGTALTSEQVKLIKRYAPKVTVLFDGDEAGIRASLRGIDMLLEGGLDVKAVRLPNGEDPDSYSKQLSVSAFRNFLETSATDIIDFKTQLLTREAGDDPIQRAAVIRELVGSISKIGDSIKRELYIQKCSRQLGISEQVLISEQNKLLLERGRQPVQRQRDEFEPPPEVNTPLQEDGVSSVTYQEQESIRLILNYGGEIITKGDNQDIRILEYILSEIEEIQFTQPVYARILETYKKQLSEGILIDAKYFLDHEDQEIHDTVIDLLTSPYEVSENWNDKFKIYVPQEIERLKEVTYSNILRLKFRVVQHLLEKKCRQLDDQALNPDQIDDFLEDIQQLKNVEMNIAQHLGNVVAK